MPEWQRRCLMVAYYAATVAVGILFSPFVVLAAIGIGLCSATPVTWRQHGRP